MDNLYAGSVVNSSLQPLWVTLTPKRSNPAKKLLRKYINFLAFIVINFGFKGNHLKKIIELYANKKRNQGKQLCEI